jgi:sortase A
MADGEVLDLRTAKPSGGPRLVVAPPTLEIEPVPAAATEDEKSEKSESREASRSIGAIRGVGLVVTAIAAVLVLFLVYLFLLSGLQAQRAQHHLRHLLKPGEAALLGQVPASGQPVAILHIPAIGVESVVVEGASAGNLEGGPGLIPGTAVPGAAGVSGIAGRRVTFGAPFGRLDQLHRGDDINVVSPLGKFTYHVQFVAKVPADKPLPTAPRSNAQLDLITSNPPLTASGRLVAVSTLVGAPSNTSPSTGVLSAAEEGLHGDHNAEVPALLWTELLIAALVATFLIYRRWRQPLVTWILATPVLIALALLSFGEIVRLLPATL